MAGGMDHVDMSRTSGVSAEVADWNGDGYPDLYGASVIPLQRQVYA